MNSARSIERDQDEEHLAISRASASLPNDDQFLRHRYDISPTNGAPLSSIHVGAGVTSNNDGDSASCVSSLTNNSMAYYFNKSIYPKAPSQSSSDSDNEEKGIWGDPQLFPTIPEEGTVAERTSTSVSPSFSSAASTNCSSSLAGPDSLESRVASKIRNQSVSGIPAASPLLPETTPEPQEEISEDSVIAEKKKAQETGVSQIYISPRSIKNDREETTSSTKGLLERLTPGNGSDKVGDAPPKTSDPLAAGQQPLTNDPISVPGALHIGLSNAEQQSMVALSDDLISNASATILATANMVDPDQLQVAQQFVRQPLRKQRILELVLVCLVLVVIVTVTATVSVVVVSKRQEEPLNGATMSSPSVGSRTEREREDISKVIFQTMDVSYSTSQTASWKRAMEWILDGDPLRLSPAADNLLQRFWLAYFYFSTTEGQLWSSCNPIIHNSSSSATTTRTRNTTSTHHLCYHEHITGDGIYTWVYTHWTSERHEMLAARWLSGQHECQWAGIYCTHNEERNVEILQLDFMNLTGTVPDKISVLSDLRSISFANNNLAGSLPESLADLSNLTFLDLQQNQFTGTVPDVWWKSQDMQRSLHRMNLAYNPLSSWTLPGDVGGFSLLEHFVLHDSGLTGTIPVEVYELTKLDYLGMSYNSLTGTIATEVGQLSNLFILSLSRSLLTGPLPSEISQLSKVSELDLWDSQLSGPIPEEFYFGNYENLWALIFTLNEFSGTISTSIGRLTSLGYILMSQMPELVGTLPSELGLLTNLFKITTEATGLRGSMPSEVCDLRGVILSRIKADCGETSNGTTPMECPLQCCTNCCNIETGTCKKTGY